MARKFKSRYKKVNFLWFKATFLKINYIVLIKVGMLYKIDYGHIARPPVLGRCPSLHSGGSNAAKGSHQVPNVTRSDMGHLGWSK